jgi:hypothetical protein
MKPDSAFLGVISGQDGIPMQWVMRFVQNAGMQDGVCAGKLELSPEALFRSGHEGVEELGLRAVASRIDELPLETQGLRFGSAECDAFHIYWDPVHADFEWWRL